MGVQVFAPRGSLLPGWAAFAATLPVAALVHIFTQSAGDRPERALILAGALFALLAPLPAAVYLNAQRRARVVPGRLAVVVLASVVALAAASGLFWMSGQVFFPADVLIWSESDFVNDILKLRTGHPLYTAQQNNDSFVYTPGTQALTWALASLAGHGDSVAAYRVVQVGFTAAAAGVAMLCCRLLLAAARGREGDERGIAADVTLWSAVWMPALFLVASNSLTNPFVQNLHNDALAQLISVVCYWLLLRYALAPRTPDGRVEGARWVLVAMAVLPGLSFLVKQSLIIWGPLYVGYLVVFDRPRSWARIVGFGAAALATLVVTVGACFWAFGPEFRYWAFEVLGKHGVSPLRSVQHVLDVWIYFAAGLAGGLVLLRGDRVRRLGGLFVVWLLFIGMEAYSSGIAYMLNHLGPGCLLAGVWFLTAVAATWGEAAGDRAALPAIERWARPAALVACGALLLSGLGAVRLPLPSVPKDAYRYIGEIEREFAGMDPSAVLLDAGTWMYQKDGVIQKDRAPTIGERGWSNTGDFSAFVKRLDEKRYSKIIVRQLHSPMLWYDAEFWPVSSGIKAAILRNYREVRTIPAVEDRLLQKTPYLWMEASVLVPKSE